MIDPTIIGITILFIWNIILSVSKASDATVRAEGYKVENRLTAQFLKDVQEQVGKEFAGKAVDDYLREKWFGYYGQRGTTEGEGSKLAKEISANVTRHVEDETRAYLSLETTVDDIVNKLNKKQLKG